MARLAILAREGTMAVMMQDGITLPKGEVALAKVTVHGPDGKPVPNAWVSVTTSPIHQGIALLFQQGGPYGVTNADGMVMFGFTSMVAGSTCIHFECGEVIVPKGATWTE